MTRASQAVEAPQWRGAGPALVRSAGGLALGMLLGSVVHGACMVVAYGMGYYGHNALPFAVEVGAVVGAVAKGLCACSRCRVAIKALGLGAAAAASLGGLVAWRLSTPLSFPRDHALGMDSVWSMVAFAFVATTLTVAAVSASNRQPAGEDARSAPDTRADAPFNGGTDGTGD